MFMSHKKESGCLILVRAAASHCRYVSEKLAGMTIESKVTAVIITTLTYKRIAVAPEHIYLTLFKKRSKLLQIYGTTHWLCETRICSFTDFSSLSKTMSIVLVAN